jgi:NADPH:quinone reductase-like Zn-dependent oxidoreductase
MLAPVRDYDGKGEGLVVLVTGGTGFIGSHLLQRLVQLNDEVRTVVGLVRASSNCAHFPPGTPPPPGPTTAPLWLAC